MSIMPTGYNPAIAGKRKQRDIAKLLMSDYKVTQSKHNKNDMLIEFPGPQDTLYTGGCWTVHVLLPEQYPYKSPSIGFMNKIFHPNVDEASGSVCLDVINQNWSPMFDLLNIFDTFLPQLLSYPNPHDPLNPEAASLMNKDIKRYESKVREYVKNYAVKEGQEVLLLKSLSSQIIPDELQLKVKQEDSRDSYTSQTPPSTATTRRDSSEMDEEIVSPDAKPFRLDDGIDDKNENHSIMSESEEIDEGNISVISVESLSELSDNEEIDPETLKCFC